MGRGLEYVCTNCGHRYEVNLGCGMMYPRVYERTVDEILDGKYGQELKETFESVQCAAINAEKVLYYCAKCKAWEVSMDLSIYAPNDVNQVKQSKFGQKTVEEWGGIPYAMKHWLDDDFHLLKQDVHTCKNCGTIMDKYTSSSDVLTLSCPKCQTENNPEPFSLNWD